ncbi:ABC transporter substrate-binding protein [Avibacterium paragallinarum]|uniref:ABC transporter substrate-binding protein n=1 Tax=Avibacterium paragallinarum TaxID=728 RepID=UPI00021AD2D7|nr:ABC transporter substrate-binding protein [Avibacterium paragallinarum]AZI14604.1 ABC transporter substrate-binding protein [Avibacterium paragallinarum]QJE10115.1 ABC transporter substrate-binding protein [Avibacterium paragallinarum]QJE12309.1 ABC transporter substrate-binding protein [Avibacterium paragallinarum]QJE14512.1 ABC transporter substrate-binding protein [Avibacterium paragallinarum]QJE16711.1 ABC transporter substrate-binding protein [Avibacterium paragallinarum]
MFIRKIISIITFILTFLASVAIQAAPKIPDSLTQNGLIYCTHANGLSFNPQTNDAGTNMNVVTEQIYNKLFEIRNNSSIVEPVLAKNYSISEDGRTITINLRKGIKFHHTDWFTPGRNFNAEDVVFSLNRVLQRNTDLPTLESSANYQNPQYQVFHEQARKVHFPYFESIKLNDKIESIIATSPYQVQIKLFQPDASILSHLASQYAIIFSQEYALQLNADDNLSQLDSLPVGTGPYKVKNFVKNQYIRLIKNEHYWRKKGTLNNIIIDLSTDKTGRLIKFLNGECQITSMPDVSQLGILKKFNEKYYLKFTEGVNLSYLAFNFAKSTIKDPKLRQAISQSINRRRIVQRIYHNTASIANNIIPSISWAATVNTPDFTYDYNPQLAKAFFQDKHLKLTMWVLNEEQFYNPSPLKMAELIKWDLSQVGVDISILPITRTYLLEQLKNNAEDYDLILTGWLAGNLDPDSFMRPILSCGISNDVTNLSNWCYAPFEQAMNKGLSTSNLRERAKYYNVAQDIILSELPIIPIANAKRMLIANTKVKGLELAPFGSINFTTLSYQQGEKQ